MPQRLLKPGLLTSKRWNTLSWPAQSLYVRLLTVVDDFGRYEADPQLLARQLFPYGEPFTGRTVKVCLVKKWLEQLVRVNLCVLFGESDVKFLHLTRWTERRRAKFSRYPAPPGWVDEEKPGQEAPGDEQQQVLAIASNALADAGNLNCHADAKEWKGKPEKPPKHPMPANDSKCPQSAGKCPLTPTTTTTSNSTGEEEGGAARQNRSGLAASRTQYAALRELVKEAEARVGDLTAMERRELAQNQRRLRELQKKQAQGIYG